MRPVSFPGSSYILYYWLVFRIYNFDANYCCFSNLFLRVKTIFCVFTRLPVNYCLCVLFDGIQLHKA